MRSSFVGSEAFAEGDDVCGSEFVEVVAALDGSVGVGEGKQGGHDDGAEETNCQAEDGVFVVPGFFSEGVGMRRLDRSGQ